MQEWTDIARVEREKSYLERVCWPYDKYPELPQLTAGAKIVLIDTDGPGVVTNIHSSRMDFLDDVLDTTSAREPDAYQKVMIDITYDHHTAPDISMPLCEFLGDIDGVCSFYRTIYFSKVAYSHNFRLPIPFQKHIRITLTNTSNTDLISYTELQWKKLESLPADVGYLRTAYWAGNVCVPEECVTLCDVHGAGTVKAHWLALGTDLDLAWDGEYICEGNQEFYVDGEENPSLEYLGTEDVYGHSWGFAGTGGDDHTQIIRMDHPTETRTEIAMLRCRSCDSVSFQKELKVVLDYRDEYYAASSKNPLHKQGVFAARKRTSYPLSIRSCFYYYCLPEE